MPVNSAGSPASILKLNFKKTACNCLSFCDFRITIAILPNAHAAYANLFKGCCVPIGGIMKKNAISKFGIEHQVMDLSIQKFLIFVQREVDDCEKRSHLIGNSFGDHLSWKIILMIAWSNLKNHCLSVGDLARNLNYPKPLLSRIVKILAKDGVVSIEDRNDLSEQILSFTNMAENRIFNYLSQKYEFDATLLQKA